MSGNLGSFFNPIYFGGYKTSVEDTLEGEETAVNMKYKYRNDDLVASLVRSSVRGVVGTGLNIRSNTGRFEYDRQIDGLLDEWGEVGNCELTGRLHFRGTQKLFQANITAYGGIIVRHHFNKTFEYGYKFEMIDVNRIDTSYNNNNYTNGIATNKYGQITFIRIFTDAKFTRSVSVKYSDLTLIQTPWDDVHRYSPLSPLKPAIRSTEFLREFGDSSLQAEKEKSKRGIIIGSKFYSSLTDYYTKLLEQAKNMFKTNSAKSKELAEETKGKVDGLRIQSADGVQYIPHGDEVHNMNIMNNTNYEELNKETKKTISSSAGNSAMDVFNDNPSSYNAALLGQNKAERTFSMDADDLFELLLKKIVSNAIKGFKIKGLINAPDFYTNKRKYVKLTYDRITTAHIDPTKTEKAISMALENGTTTIIDEASKNGYDWREQLEKDLLYKKTKKEMKKKMKKAKNEV
jgi:capsid protein